MIGRLSDHWQAVQSRLAAADHLLLGLDYDGTLSPLVENPADAGLAPGNRELLTALSRVPDVHLAVISGRALDDVRERIGVPGMYYAGNHGLDISGPGCRFIAPAAFACQESLAQLRDALGSVLRNIHGAAVEDKALSLSVHFRRVAPGERSQVNSLVEQALAGEHIRFRLRQGNMVLEILPRVDWDKGLALSWIRGRLPAKNVLTIYFGDDRTDEDVFRAFRNDVTVKVGGPESEAAYYVDSSADVTQFLDWCSRLAWRNGVAQRHRITKWR